MRVVNHATYVADAHVVTRLRSSHRQYIAELEQSGLLTAGGPFPDGSGALFVYNVGSLADAQDIVDRDPYQIGGAFAAVDLHEWRVIRSNPALLPDLDA